MITYPAPYARMRALKGNLLSKEQMESLVQASDYQSVISILNQTDYHDQIQNVTTSIQIEHALKQNLILSYIKILNFMRGKPAIFLTNSLERFELLNVKAIARSLIQNIPISDNPSISLFSLGKYHTIPIERAINARDFRHFIDVMSNTPFAHALEIGYQQYLEESNIMPLDIALDINYYTRLHDSFKSLGLFDKGRAEKLMGIHYDMINIIWMLRFKQNYNLTPEQIFQYILPYGWKIQASVFWKIIGSSNIFEELKERYMSPYNKIFSSMTPIEGNSILGIEVALMRYYYEQSEKALRGFPLQIASFAGFFVMKEMEIRDIMTILNGKRLGLSQERIRANLVTIV